MIHFIAKIKQPNGREFFVARFNRELVRRGKVSLAWIFNDADEARQGASKIAVDNETVHVYLFTLGGEMMFGK